MGEAADHFVETVGRYPCDERQRGQEKQGRDGQDYADGEESDGGGDFLGPHKFNLAGAE